MTALEIIALIFAISILLKSLVWLLFTDRVKQLTAQAMQYSNGIMILYIAIAAITGYFVLQEFNFVQISTIMLFTLSLIGISLIPYFDKMKDVIAKTDFFKIEYFFKSWVSLMIWLVIALLTLKEIFN